MGVAVVAASLALLGGNSTHRQFEELSQSQPIPREAAVPPELKPEKNPFTLKLLFDKVQLNRVIY